MREGVHHCDGAPTVGRAGDWYGPPRLAATVSCGGSSSSSPNMSIRRLSEAHEGHGGRTQLGGCEVRRGGAGLGVARRTLLELLLGVILHELVGAARGEKAAEQVNQLLLGAGAAHRSEDSSYGLV